MGQRREKIRVNMKDVCVVAQINDVIISYGPNEKPLKCLMCGGNISPDTLVTQIIDVCGERFVCNACKEDS